MTNGRRTRQLLAVGIAAVLAVSACSNDSGDAGGSESSGGESSGEGSGGAGNGDDGDAPLSFDPEPAFTLTEDAPQGGWPAAVLHGELAFLADWGALTVHDVTSGETVAQFEPERPLLFDPAGIGPSDAFLFPPALVDVDGEPVVLAGFAVEPSTGAVQFDVEIIAVDAATGEERWRFTAPNPTPRPRVPQNVASVVVRGAHDGVAVVETTRDAAASTTFGLALDDPEVVWTDDEFGVSGVHQGTAAGLGANGTLTAVDIVTGEQLWKGDEPAAHSAELAGYSVGPAGPWLKVSSAMEATRFVSIEDQEVAFTADDGVNGAMFCLSDVDASVVVCVEDDTEAVAMDTESGEVLWHDDSWDGRLKGLWHGAVYVARDDAAVVVDARTGDVVSEDGGVAPAVVNDHVGIAQDGTDVNVYPVAG
ncbi:PQQ-binding-like beta-propeller repeat protein [Haloactinopolyspora alba]|nr:PQQ-binding-like beta-propeller repeat protein [Haloactinopolyspora alba]